MKNNPVHWHEGMFLLPHHFQAAERFWTETLDRSERCDHAYNYGLAHIEMNPAAIANRHFQVNSYAARMRDGTLLVLEHEGPQRTDLPAGSASPAASPNSEGVDVDLKSALETQSTVKAYLAVPKYRLDGANAQVVGRSPSERAAAEPHRFLVHETGQPDENSGRNERTVHLRVLNAEVRLQTDDLSSYDTLPIAAIKGVGDDAAPQLDTNYIPPLLDVACWPPLSQGIIRYIYDRIGRKIDVLTEQVLARGVTFASLEPGDVDRVYMLSQLNEAYAVMTVWIFAAGVHPFAAYRHLCGVVGKLSIFGEARRAAMVPHYDHDDLGRIFRWVRDQIDLLLDALPDPQYEMRYFVGSGSGMQVSFNSEWLSSAWKWYVGVWHPGIASPQLLKLLTQPDQLHWKMGSKRQVDQLFERGQPGLYLVPVASAPRYLPQNPDWDYFEVRRDNVAWQDIQLTQSLAMRLQDKLISNKNILDGKRRLEVAYLGRRYELEFALIAVRADA